MDTLLSSADGAQSVTHRPSASQELVKTNLPSLMTWGISMTDDGLILGLSSVLVRMKKDTGERRYLDLVADLDRFSALTSVAFGQSIQCDLLHHIEAADGYYQGGDKALANLRLTLADLPRLGALSDACRLALAAHLLDQGMTPNNLMKELGLNPPEALKYAPDQARVPAGHGRESGRFTFGREPRASTGDPIVVASEEGASEDGKDFLEHSGQSAPVPEKDPTRHHTISPITQPFPAPPPASLPTGVGVGPFAGKSIAAGPGRRPSSEQQRQINEIGRETGCHTCGMKDSGLPNGNFVADHQLPKKLNSAGESQRYFPQCWHCSNVQGGKVRHFPKRTLD